MTTETLGMDADSHIDQAKAAILKEDGIHFIARYFSSVPGKSMTPYEALYLKEAGVYAVSVYEDDPTYGGYFSTERGTSDGHTALGIASTVGQPAGSAIYFTVDYDAQPEDYHAIGLYAVAFKAVVEAAGYVVGAYGSGAVLSHLLGLGHITKAWLAESTGWAGYHEFLASGQWSIHQTLEEALEGLDVDLDYTAGAGGGWMTRLG